MDEAQAITIGAFPLDDGHAAVLVAAGHWGNAITVRASMHPPLTPLLHRSLTRFVSLCAGPGACRVGAVLAAGAGTGGG